MDIVAPYTARRLNGTACVRDTQKGLELIRESAKGGVIPEITADLLLMLQRMNRFNRV